MSIENINPDFAQLAITRRLGSAPAERLGCGNSVNCPDVFELSNGDFAIIGEDRSDLELPADAGRSETERTVVVPRAVLVAAFQDLSRGV
jgi:hypothetical protein